MTVKGPLEYREWDSNRRVECTYRIQTGTGGTTDLERITPTQHPWRNFFRDVFLPEGFPHSVSEDYVAYQFWDTVQAFASSISGSLATQALLKGVGVGDESATALAATLTWLMRHGTGMVGQIVFTWLHGSDLDHNCKKWRLFADVLNDGAMMIELSAPHWPEASRQVVFCVASVARSLVGVSGSATRAAITQHQARKNNISDVAAKDGSQETLVGLLALLLNLLLLPFLAQDPIWTWAVFGLMTCLHLFANYRGVTALEFRTFNRERFLRVVQPYLATGTVVDVREGNARESVVFGGQLREVDIWKRRIHLGASLAQVIDQIPATSIETIMRNVLDDPYQIISTSCDIFVIFNQDPEDAVILQAFFEACVQAQGIESSFSKFRELASAQGWGFRRAQINTQGYHGQAKKRH